MASDLLKAFDGVRYRRATLYDAPEWYDVDYANYSAEAPFYRLLVSRHVRPGRAYVEIGAGTGRIALPIANDGARVHAVEPSTRMMKTMLAHARGLTAGAGRLTTERALLADFTGPDDVPAGVVAFPFNAVLHLFTWDDMLGSFAHARDRLAEDGVFALDLTGPSWEAMSIGGMPWGRVDDRVHPARGTHVLTCDKTIYRTEDRVLASTYRFLEDEAEEGWEITLEQKMWTWQEVLHGLELAGFTVELCFGDVDFQPFAEGSPRLLVSARKT